MQTSLSREQRRPEACGKQNESLGLPSAHLISLEIPNSNPSSSTVGGSSSCLVSFTVLSKEGVIKQTVLFTEHQLWETSGHPSIFFIIVRYSWSVLQLKKRASNWLKDLVHSYIIEHRLWRETIKSPYSHSLLVVSPGLTSKLQLSLKMISKILHASWSHLLTTIMLIHVKSHKFSLFFL